jgi:hypothetical protein
MEELISGLSPEEEACMQHLVDAWKLFAAMPIQHPADQPEFVLHIHALQNILAARAIARAYPHFWTIHE